MLFYTHKGLVLTGGYPCLAVGAGSSGGVVRALAICLVGILF